MTIFFEETILIPSRVRTKAAVLQQCQVRKEGTRYKEGGMMVQQHQT
jgi:hypothetical protein